MAKVWVLVLLFGLVLTHGLQRVRAEEEEEDGAVVEEDEADDPESERAQLVVRKSVSKELGVQGRNITITIELHNAGTSSAKDVRVVDAPLPDELVLLEGSLQASFPTIEPGAAFQHTYVVLAAKGEKGHHLEPATVTYIADAEGSKQVTRSSRPGMYIMTPVEQITRYALIAGRYATLGMARSPADWRNLAIFLVVVGGALGANSAYKATTAARTDARRKKALASLEKDS